jgi:hypothetical protein
MPCGRSLWVFASPGVENIVGPRSGFLSGHGV